jgi:hypothetical protein
MESISTLSGRGLYEALSAHAMTFPLENKIIKKSRYITVKRIDSNVWGSQYSLD